MVELSGKNIISGALSGEGSITFYAENPAHATNYFGNKQTGEFLKKIMYPGASRNWREVLKEATGEDMNAKAMLRYFDPLMTWLKEQNKGRKYTLPETL